MVAIPTALPTTIAKSPLPGAKIEKLRRGDPKPSIRLIAKAVSVAYKTARAHIRSLWAPL